MRLRRRTARGLIRIHIAIGLSLFSGSSDFVGRLSGSLSGNWGYPTGLGRVDSVRLMLFVGFVGFSGEERGPVNSETNFRHLFVEMCGCGRSRFRHSGVREMDSSWTPKRRLDEISGCNSLRNLVGLPGFEPGTSCTPSTKPASTGSVISGVVYGLHALGASASAHRRWPENQFNAHFPAHSGALASCAGVR